MRLPDFDKLTFNEKARLILKDGVYVTKSKFFHLEISLYRLNDEFVEIWYEPVSEQITKIKYLLNEKVNPYLKHLNITSLN